MRLHGDPIAMLLIGLFLVSIGAAFALAARHLLRVDHVQANGTIYTRQQDPLSYWTFVCMFVFGAMTCLGVPIAGFAAALFRAWS
jgi:hypothetical protein